MYNFSILDPSEPGEDNLCKVNRWGRQKGRITEKVNKFGLLKKSIWFKFEKKTGIENLY